jgi:exonuclease 3'-5' domain-containing protein 2
MSRTVHQGQSRIWHPSQGIVFVNMPPLSEPSSSQTLSTISASDSKHDRLEKPNTADPCLVNSTLEISSSDSEYARSSSHGSTDVDGSSWVPSSTSQDSNVINTSRLYASELDQGVEDEDQKELHTPLAFRIPQDVLQKAKDATPGTKESFWSYKMYLGPDNQEVKVHYCRSKNTTERVAQYFADEAVIGFDIEWNPEATKNSGIKNNVALIQLACETRIALFHIAAFSKDTVSDLVTPTVKKIMEDPDITKVGVAIKADCTRLRNYLNINPKGIFELSHLYKLVKYSFSGDENKINKRLVSLTTQAEEHLGLPIFKGEVRGSDWTQSLSIDQIKCQFL